jgi:hypothetical protein
VRGTGSEKRWSNTKNMFIKRRRAVFDTAPIDMSESIHTLRGKAIANGGYREE